MPLSDDELTRIIRQMKLVTTNLSMLRNLLDLESSRDQTSEPNYSPMDMCILLNIPFTDSGPKDMLQYYNAVLNIQGNPAYQAAPYPVRMKMLRTAAAILSR